MAHACAAARTCREVFATAAWLRYGHQKPIDTNVLLDGFLPEPEVLEHHEIRVNAPAETAYNAARNLDLTQSRRPTEYRDNGSNGRRRRCSDATSGAG